MLNTKYLLFPSASGRGDSVALNPNALGAVWFVRGIRFAPTPRAVMDALTGLDTRDTAILFTADAAATAGIKPIPPQDDTTRRDSIVLIHNDNDEMTYHSTSAYARFAVFSEVYYNRGWKAFIDGTEAPIIRTDFVLRGLSIPAGSHDIRFTFHPTSYYTGRSIQVIASILLYLLLTIAAFYTFPLKTNTAAKLKTT
jgi:hypothetical protein